MQMSVGVLEQRLPEEQRESLDDIREDADHMSAMENELLSFSRHSLRDSAMELRSVDAVAIIAQALHRETVWWRGSIECYCMAAAKLRVGMGQ
jgi:signal transduction histidine kinase